jgi:hypothetical protein
MRLQVTLLRDKAAEKRARDKAAAPTVKTEEQMKADETAKAKERAHPNAVVPPKSIWKRRFRPLQEDKAVDLFADVIGDSFILLVAAGLIMYELVRNSNKPDPHQEKIAALEEKVVVLEKLDQEREEIEKKQQQRVETLEQAMEEMRKTTLKKKFFPLA